MLKMPTESPEAASRPLSAMSTCSSEEAELCSYRLWESSAPPARPSLAADCNQFSL